MAIDIPRLDPLPAFNFYIALIDESTVASTLVSGLTGFLLGGFAECSGLESTLEVEEYREGGVNDRVHRLEEGSDQPKLFFSKRRPATRPTKSNGASR